MFNKLNKLDSHMQELLHGAAVAFALKVMAAGVTFGLNVVLARLLGAEGSGIFFLTFTIVLIVSALGRIGMDNALVKFIAANIAANKINKVIGVYDLVIFYSLFAATVLSLLLFLLAPWISNTVFIKPELEGPLSIMAFSVLPLALLTLHAHAFQGLKNIVASISIQSLSVPIITCILAVLFVPKFGINAAVWGYLLSTICTLLLARWLWLQSIKIFTFKKVGFNRKELFACSIPLFGVVMMNLFILWSPLLFLGVWESNENIGIYSAATRTAMLTSFILVAVNSIAAPKFAALFQQNDIQALGALARNSTKIMMLLALPALLLFLSIPELVLSIFGEQFRSGAPLLMILSFGQFINVATGSVGYLLMMSGNEKMLRNNLFFCSFLSILLNLLLIPEYGVMGAALASMLVLSVQNLISVVIVKKKLNIDTIGWLKKNNVF